MEPYRKNSLKKQMAPGGAADHRLSEGRRVEEEEDHFDICQNACSTTDCTGLIPNLPDDEEIEAYQEVYDFLPKAVKAKKDME